MKNSVRWTTIALTAILLAWGGHQAEATILIFDQSAPNTPTSNFATVSQAYGDNVTAVSQGGFTYLVGPEGFTPNVVVAYGPVANDVHMWTTDYGDLVNVIYRETDGVGPLDVVLSAAAGFVVRLHDFDMGGWPDTDRIINSVQVLDATNTPLFSASNVLIQGAADGTAHTDFNFATPLQSSTLTIRFDASNLGGNSDDVGIDNIRFSQAQVDQQVVPEPGTLLLLGSGLTGLAAAWRRRRR
jgi:PEP-CTERM motif